MFRPMSRSYASVYPKLFLCPHCFTFLLIFCPLCPCPFPCPDLPQGQKADATHVRLTTMPSPCKWQCIVDCMQLFQSLHLLAAVHRIIKCNHVRCGYTMSYIDIARFCKHYRGRGAVRAISIYQHLYTRPDHADCSSSRSSSHCIDVFEIHKLATICVHQSSVLSIDRLSLAMKTKTENEGERQAAMFRHHFEQMNIDQAYIGLW